MIKLTIEQVIKLHNMMILKTGGAEGLRDEGLLSSAIFSPFQTFDAVDIYPSIEEKAARIGFGLVMNHPFVDGNKRTGLFAMLVFLELNGIILKFTQTELIDLGIGLADGSFDSKHVVRFIQEHKQIGQG